MKANRANDSPQCTGPMSGRLPDDTPRPGRMAWNQGMSLAEWHPNHARNRGSMSDPERTQTPEDMVRASVFLEYYGSSSHDPKQWHKWRYAETDYAPEWLTKEDLSDGELDFTDRDDCVTVLDFSLATPEPPTGWRLAYQYQAGEKDCPWCHPDDQPADCEHQPKRSECKLCEGDGMLYWGEECTVVVFAPALTPDTAHAELVELLERRDNTGAPQS